MSHKVIEVRDISPTTFLLRLERNGFEFKPGQCVNLGVRGSGVNREYSSYSGINDPYLEFLVKEVKGGTVSPALHKAKPGDAIELHGPYGSFMIDPEKIGKANFVFVGTGTGIAPFHSFVKSFPELNYKVIIGARTVEDQYDFQDYDPERLICCVSREKWDGFSGRVTDYLKADKIDPTAIYYLCGNQNMIHDVYDLLRVEGVSGDNLFTEAFF